MQINPTAEQFVPAHLRRKVPGEYLLTSKNFWFVPAYLPTNLPGKAVEVNERNRINRFCFPSGFFSRSKENLHWKSTKCIFQLLKKQQRAKSKVRADRWSRFNFTCGIWGKLPSVKMENLDLPKLELSSNTSTGKGGVQMAVAAQLLLKFVKPVGQIMHTAPWTYTPRCYLQPQRLNPISHSYFHI